MLNKVKLYCFFS